MFLVVVSLLSRGINLPVGAFISIFFHLPFSFKWKVPGDSYHIFARLFVLNVFQSPFCSRETEKHNLFNYGWQLMRCICYHRIFKEFFSCPIMLRLFFFPSFLFAFLRCFFRSDFFFRRDAVKQLHTSFFGQLQIEFKRRSVVVYFMEIVHQMI